MADGVALTITAILIRREGEDSGESATGQERANTGNGKISDGRTEVNRGRVSFRDRMCARPPGGHMFSWTYNLDLACNRLQHENSMTAHD